MENYSDNSMTIGIAYFIIGDVSVALAIGGIEFFAQDGNLLFT